MKTAEKPKLAEKGPNRTEFVFNAQRDHAHHHGHLGGKWHWRVCQRPRCLVWQRKYLRLFFKADV